MTATSDLTTAVPPTRLTTSEMLAAIASCRPFAHALAKRFHLTNPNVPLRDLNAAAMFALKVAALKFDPSRGNKFITPAGLYIKIELINYCRVESARGMHVPTDHKPYYAPAPSGFAEPWQHPTTTDERNELGEDFWESVARTLDDRDARVILRVFRDGVQQKDVAGELGVSKARVGQLYERAVRRLREREDLKELAGTGRKVA